jgi:hypothetical protein
MQRSSKLWPEGLTPYAGNQAYIYRHEASGAKKEVPIDLRPIRNRESFLTCHSRPTAFSTYRTPREHAPSSPNRKSS